MKFKQASLYYKLVILLLINLFHRPEFGAAFIVVSIYTMINGVEKLVINNGAK